MTRKVDHNHHHPRVRRSKVTRQWVAFCPDGCGALWTPLGYHSTEWRAHLVAALRHAGTPR